MLPVTPARRASFGRVDSSAHESMTRKPSSHKGSWALRSRYRNPLESNANDGNSVVHFGGRFFRNKRCKRRHGKHFRHHRTRDVPVRN